MQSKAIRWMSVLFVLAGCMLAGSRAQSGDEKSLAALPKQFAATAFVQAGPTAGKNFNLTIYVNGWTSNEQLRDDLATLKEKGQDALVSAMEKREDVGRVAPEGFTGIGFRFAQYRPLPNGGMHIVMATNRPITFGELYNATRSTDYPFGILVIDVNKDGKGEGQLAPLCKVRFNKQNQLEIENYSQKPLRLANVYLQK
jgi:hypothetical protein